MFSCVSRHAVPLILFRGTLSSGGFFALLCFALLCFAFPMISPLSLTLWGPGDCCRGGGKCFEGYLVFGVWPCSKSSMLCSTFFVKACLFNRRDLRQEH
jgi:hypothetical protein